MYNSDETHGNMSTVEWECTEVWQTTGSDAPSTRQGPAADFIEIHVRLHRKNGWYVENVVGPTVLLVIISWAAFFINRAAAPARVALSIICYLTLSNLSNSVLALLPKISYDVRLLLFITRSKILVFLSILEYALANLLMRVEKRVEAAAKEVANEPTSTSGPVAAETNKVHLEMVASGEVLPSRESSFASLANFVKRPSKLRGVRASNVSAMKKRLNGIDRVLTNSRGQLYFRDQHLDIVCRWTYLMVYAVFVGLFFG